MGLPKRELWVTNTGAPSGNIFLSAYKPVKKEDGRYYTPPEIPLGYDMWIPNCLGLKPEEGIVRVEIVETEEETGLWLICVNDYFGNEQHLYAGEKPIHRPPEQRYGDYEGFRDWIIDDPYNSLHIWTEIKMKAGDGPINVKPKRKPNKR
jgi:hypothetical protein